MHHAWTALGKGCIAPRILNLLPGTKSVVSIIPKEVSLGPV